jgi:hypothetical protein
MGDVVNLIFGVLGGCLLALLFVLSFPFSDTFFNSLKEISETDCDEHSQTPK